MKKVAIIVAGGSGSRMNAPLPKQFLLIADEPVLFHTLRKFEGEVNQVVLVMHPDWIAHWEQLISHYQFPIHHSIIAGGASRAESVYNGLQAIEGDCLIAVHDAARPLVSKELIKRTFEGAAESGACIPAITVKESMRQINEHGVHHVVDRNQFRIVQTPQVFQSELLHAAYKQINRHLYLDDASLVEANGKSICIIDGEESNIKITTPTDLLIAQQLI